jgi:hypothetical protein
MEHNGALSNPQARVELSRLADLSDRLRAQARLAPRSPRLALAKASPVLDTVTRVLERSTRPMRVHEIHAAAELLLGKSIRSASVRGVLSAYTIGGDHRFRRLGRGAYLLTQTPRRSSSSVAE